MAAMTSRENALYVCKNNRTAMLVYQTIGYINILLLKVHQHGGHDVWAISDPGRLQPYHTSTVQSVN